MDEIQEPSGLTRRDVMKRGAVVGGALVWATPVVQSIASPAFAAGSGSTVGLCLDKYKVLLEANDGVFTAVLVASSNNGNGCTPLEFNDGLYQDLQTGATFEGGTATIPIGTEGNLVITLSQLGKCASLAFPSGCQVEKVSVKSGSQGGQCEATTLTSICTAGTNTDAISFLAIAFCCN